MLGLNGRIATHLAEWKAQGERYYEKAPASEEIRADIAKYNVPQELLTQGRANRPPAPRGKKTV